VNWEDLKLSPETLEFIQKAGYAQPTPVQAGAIPVAMEGKDVIASAQTGTGKTASFVLPMVERFAGKQGTYGLVLAPTREIAQQIQATFEIFGAPRGVRSIVLIGGIDMKIDEAAIQSYPQVIVATPGRLCDHLDRGNIWLEFIQMVVLDEADRMLDMGFTDQLSRIMQDVPSARQTLLFSATFTAPVEKLARKILHEPVRIAIGKPQSTATTVEQSVRWMSESEKNRELRKLINEEKGSIIVFTRSKQGATNVWRSLHSNGVYDATYIHSDRLQSHREQALAEFKEGKYRILIATDVAARGIHVDAVAHVVNFDLPLEPEDYVHRIGRTGRAGATGRATTFVTPRDRALLKQIERLIGFRLGSAPSSQAEAPMAQVPAAQVTDAQTLTVQAESAPVETKEKAPEASQESSASGSEQAESPTQAVEVEARIGASQASRSEERTGRTRRPSRRDRDQKRREQREGQQDWERETSPRRYAFPVEDIPPGVKSNGPVTALSVISLDNPDYDDLDDSSSQESESESVSEKASESRSKGRSEKQDRGQRKRRRRRRGVRSGSRAEGQSASQESSSTPPSDPVT
jgi:ATP-dependent RNA helicase RhlE